MQYTEVMKARMIRRLSGPHAITASALAEETGIPQPTLSRWLREACGLAAWITVLLCVSRANVMVSGHGSKVAGD